MSFARKFNGKSEPSISKPATDFKCEHVGRFAHPGDCEKYYFCWDSVHDYAVFPCPHHKAFDPITQQCVHNFAVCAAASKCEFDLQRLPNPNHKSSYLQCNLNLPDVSAENHVLEIQFGLYEKNCARRGEFDAELGYCKLLEEDESENDTEHEQSQMECKEAGVFIDHSDESRYYECVVKSVTYRKLHQTCPNYHVFSMADKRCIKLEANEK